MHNQQKELTMKNVRMILAAALAVCLISLTSLTTFIVVGILYIFGGEGIHGFAFCLVLGVIVGTYSSIYVASPVLLWLMKRDDRISAGQTSSSGTAKTAAAS